MTISECFGGMHAATAQVVFNRLLPGGHGLVRLAVGELAGLARPGHFLQLNCGPSLTLPRPFSLMDADPEQGTVDLFYRIVGRGTELLSRWQSGERVRVLLPLGREFELPAEGSVLLIAGGAGLAPLHFLARFLVRRGVSVGLVWGIEVASPLVTIEARADAFTHLDCFGGGSPVALAGLDALDVSTRLAAMDRFPGRFRGYVTDLALRHLEGLEESLRRGIRLYACGPVPMLVAVAGLAARFGLSGQVSLEERMACGFGGCAACVVPVRDEAATHGWSYRKVCTDGPVFAISDVAWLRYGRSSH